MCQKKSKKHFRQTDLPRTNRQMNKQTEHKKEKQVNKQGHKHSSEQTSEHKNIFILHFEINASLTRLAICDLQYSAGSHISTYT